MYDIGSFLITNYGNIGKCQLIFTNNSYIKRMEILTVIGFNWIELRVTMHSYFFKFIFCLFLKRKIK